MPVYTQQTRQGSSRPHLCTRGRGVCVCILCTQNILTYILPKYICYLQNLYQHKTGIYRCVPDSTEEILGATRFRGHEAITLARWEGLTRKSKTKKKKKKRDTDRCTPEKSRPSTDRKWTPGLWPSPGRVADLHSGPDLVGSQFCAK